MLLHKDIIIPMQGEIDSMNVSVAAAILIFENKRQSFKTKKNFMKIDVVLLPYVSVTFSFAQITEPQVDA
jgi:tRNA C32,U32 (ribose-2'-O)-methylase TrmJ